MAPQYRSSTSYKHYTITSHARQRAIERLGMADANEIKKVACKVKHKGLNLQVLKSCAHDPEQKNYIKSILRKHKLKQEDVTFFINTYSLTDNKKYYYFENNVWVFGGNGKRTLCTVIPCSPEDRERGRMIKKMGWAEFKEKYPDGAREHYKSDDDMKMTKLMRKFGGKF